MEDTVYTRLQQTPDEYEQMIMNIWFTWCNEKSNTRKSLQKVLICQPLFNWWQRELQKLEHQFLEETIFLEDKNHAKKVYAEFTVEIYSRFSKPLIKKAYE